MLFLRKFLKLPTPRELGWGDYDALPSKEFTPDCDGPTWEDWHVEIKKLHPIKYWIAETFGDFVRYNIWFPIIHPLKDFHYWIVSHLIPSRRFHMLDLRQPIAKGELANHDTYRYGWADVCNKMLYAMFNLLGEYLKEEPYDLIKDYTLEQINADAGMKIQHECLQEAKDIYQWWRVGRKEEQKIYDDLLARWCDLRKDKISRDNGEADQMFKILKSAENGIEEKTDEMIARLIKIRRNLWT